MAEPKPPNPAAHTTGSAVSAQLRQYLEARAQQAQSAQVLVSVDLLRRVLDGDAQAGAELRAILDAQP